MFARGVQRRHGLDCLRCRLVRPTTCRKPSAWLHVQHELSERHSAGALQLHVLQLCRSISFKLVTCFSGSHMSFSVSFFSSFPCLGIWRREARATCRSASPTRSTTCTPLRAWTTTPRLLGGKVCFVVPFSQNWNLSRMTSTQTCWQMAWEVGGGWRGMSKPAVTSSGSTLLACGFAVFRAPACRCCQRPWPPQPHDRSARADLPDREWCRNSR